MENNKKSLILSIVGVITLILVVSGATVAYFVAQGGNDVTKNANVITGTTDSLTFELGNAISINANQENFGVDEGNQEGITTGRATLRANNTTNSATANYYVYLDIESNDFEYTTEENKGELILQVIDPEGNPVESISGLSYVTTGTGANEVSGFDITTVKDIITIAKNYEIATETGMTEQEWEIKVIFVNLDSDQKDNMGKTFSGKIIMTQNNMDPTLASITKVEATEVTETSIKVSVEAIKGDYEINKYYYSIDDGSYVESTSNSYAFNNLITGTEYKIEVYVEDEEGNKSEVYELNQSTANNIGAITVNQNMTLNVSEYSVASSINFTGNYTLTINGGGTLEVASITSSNGTNEVGSATNGANITINLENVKLVNNTITSGYGGNGTGDAGSDGGRGSEYSKDGKDGDAATATVQGGNGGTITINIDENSEFISQTITTGKGGNATGAAGGNGGAGANATSGGSNEYRTGGNGGNGGNGSNSIGGSSGSVVINNQGIVTINSVITDKGGDAYGGNGGDGGDRGDHYSSSHLYASGGDGGNGGDATGGNSGSITINGNGQSLINNASTGAVGVSTAGTGGNGGSGDSYGSRGETGNIISGTKGVISGI